MTNILRESSFILPVVGNEGEDLECVHKVLRMHLSRYYGGYTGEQVFGGWLDDKGELFTDHSIRYTVAHLDTLFERNVMLDTAIKYGAMAGQKAIYVKLSNGNVIVAGCELESADLYELAA